MSKNKTTYLIRTPEGQRLVAEFRWTVSRGRDTYGYNICSLWLNGTKVESCNGGGYDMQGTCLGTWLQKHAGHKGLKGLTANYGSGDNGHGLYGLRFWKKAKDHDKTGRVESPKEYSEGTSITIDGACGLDSVKRIGEAIGYSFEYIN